MSDEQMIVQEGERPCSRTHLHRVERMFRDGSVIKRAEGYVRSCQTEKNAKSACFPNLAGLGRNLGVGLCEMCRLGEKYPQVYDAILAVLEDGALNAECLPGKSALLAMTYFRRRLGYEQPKQRAKVSEGDAVRVVFEHDIMEDGK